MPIFGTRYNCPSNQKLIIENAPGENVVFDGTDLSMETGNKWSQCSSTHCCGEPVNTSVNGISNLTKYYCSDQFNVGSAMTPQLWVAPADDYSSDVGDRLQWWANSNDQTGSENVNDHFRGMGPGKFFAAKYGYLVVLRLRDDANPNTKKIKLNCQEGSCAAHLISVTGRASNVVVRRSRGSGKFQLKYAYFPIYSDANSFGAPSGIQFSGLEIMAAGGRDYGQCVRVARGDSFKLSRINCHDSMAIS